ncbi:hypothetical protein AGLY_009830, partial [Aphis glycines]
SLDVHKVTAVLHWHTARIGKRRKCSPSYHAMNMITFDIKVFKELPKKSIFFVELPVDIEILDGELRIYLGFALLNMDARLVHLLLFLKIGVIYEDFHCSGKISDNKDLLNKEVIAGVSKNAHFFKNNGEISSGPIAVISFVMYVLENYSLNKLTISLPLLTSLSRYDIFLTKPFRIFGFANLNFRNKFSMLFLLKYSIKSTFSRYLIIEISTLVVIEFVKTFKSANLLSK